MKDGEEDKKKKRWQRKKKTIPEIRKIKVTCDRVVIINIPMHY